MKICSSLDLDKALLSCYEFLSEILPLNFVNLTIWNKNLKYPEVISSVEEGMIETDLSNSGYFHLRMPEELRFYLKESWEKSGYVRMINYWDQDDYSRAMKQLVLTEHNLSIISLPLQLENSTIGLFTISAIGKNRYTNDHASFISVLNEPFSIALSNDLRHRELIHLKEKVEEDNQYLRKELENVAGDRIIGAESGLLKVMKMVDQVSPMNCPVLLLGETGTGKELIANAIHYSSTRKDGPFIKVNCGAIPDSLVDSELFGHEKGAFTGAMSQKLGRFERANGGTIFLDEVGELPLKAQVRLLRVIQQSEIERVGGTNTIPIDVRIISATNRNLEQMIDLGEFREDLWFRLNVFPIVIPPMRMRIRDLPELVDYMIKRKVAQMNMNRIPELALGTIHKLSKYHWPGNVRELENVVERALIRYNGGPLDISPFYSADRSEAAEGEITPAEIIPTLNQGIANLIRQALTASNGKIYGPGGAAEILDMHPNTLRFKISKLGIKFKKNTG